VLAIQVERAGKADRQLAGTEVRDRAQAAAVETGNEEVIVRVTDDPSGVYLEALGRERQRMHGAFRRDDDEALVPGRVIEAIGDSGPTRIDIELVDLAADSLPADLALLYPVVDDDLGPLHICEVPARDARHL
jgi:hypothetical protein